MDPHDLPAGSRRSGKTPQEILDEMEDTKESASAQSSSGS
jgi:hypothetical protein